MSLDYIEITHNTEEQSDEELLLYVSNYVDRIKNLLIYIGDLIGEEYSLKVFKKLSEFAATSYDLRNENEKGYLSKHLQHILQRDFYGLDVFSSYKPEELINIDNKEIL